MINVKQQQSGKEQEKNLPAAQVKSSALAVVDFGEDAGQGMENVTAEELKVPFLNLLQPLSPQVQPVAQGGMPGAAAGMLLNGATGDLYNVFEEPLVFVPVFRTHQFLEFTPRAMGGGFVAMYGPDDPKIAKLREAQGKFGKLYTVYPPKRDQKGEVIEGTEIMETFSLYGLFQDPDTEQWFKAILSFKSTQIKKYQALIGRLTSIKYGNPRSTEQNPLPPVTPPIYAHRWSLKTVGERNKSGSFYGYQVSLAEKAEDGTELPPIKSLVQRTDPLYLEAKAFYQMLEEGRAKADYGTDKPESEEAGQSAGAKHADQPPM